MRLPARAADPSPRRSHSREDRLAVLCLAVVAMTVSLILFRHTWAHPRTYSTANGLGLQGDAPQFMWYLKWFPWAIVHGQDPFLTNRMYAPTTISLAWNTSIPALALAASPLTFTLGPILTFNVLLSASPVLTALTTRAWLRRHFAALGAAELGALSFAFGPFCAAHLRGHLNLVFLALVPLMLIWLEDLLTGRARRPRRTALLLGIAGGVQLGISEEILLITSIGVLAVTAAYVVTAPKALGGAIRRGAPYAWLAIVIGGVVASPLLLAQLVRSRALTVDNGQWIGSLSELVRPTSALLNPLGLSRVTGVPGAELEISGYVGWPMLIVLIVGCMRLWPDPRVRAAAAAGIAGFALSLGSGIGDSRYLPWFWVQDTPYLESVLPIRLTLLTQLAVAFVVAAIVERARSARPLSSGCLAALSVALAAAAMLPASIPAGHLEQPSYFSSSAVKRIPRDSTVLVLPMAAPLPDQSVLWQADADFRFRMYGGYPLHPDQDGIGTFGPLPSPFVTAVLHAQTGAPLTDIDVQAVRTQLTEDRATAILVIRDADPMGSLQRLASAVGDRGPDANAGGVSAWYLSA
jgi:hypothetical protein